MANNPGQQLDLNFQKTGKSSKVMDYSCDEYSGAGKTAIGRGLDLRMLLDQRAGRRGVYRVHKGHGPEAQERARDGGQNADGIPLTMDSTRTVNPGFSVPGMAPDQPPDSRK